MNYSLIRESKEPVRGNVGDAGIDVFIPKFTKVYKETLLDYNRSVSKGLKFNWGGDQLIIQPGERVKIPTGLYFEVPENYMLLTLEKSSVPYNTGLVIGARVVDSSYQGEYFAVLINTSNREVSIKELTKIVQVVLVPISVDTLLERVDFSEIYKIKSERGDGAFGSTGEI